MSIPLGVAYSLTVTIQQSLLDLLHLLHLHLSRPLSLYNEHRLAPIEGLGDARFIF